MTQIKVQRNGIVVKKFSEIEVGDLFTDPDYPDEIYQKTVEVKDAVYPDEEMLNAVMIAGDEAGNVIHYDDDENIIPIEDVTISY